MEEFKVDWSTDTFGTGNFGFYSLSERKLINYASPVCNTIWWI